jgi:uncharacterized membrane protein YkvA (DUF1232 family)
MQSHRDLDIYQALRSRLAAWLIERHRLLRHAQVVLLPPDLLHLIVRMVVDKRVPPAQKAQLAVAAAYVVLPIDAIPETFLGPAGFADDIAAISHALNSLMNFSHGELAKEHWAGEEELLELLQKTVKVADETSGLGFWKRIRYVLSRATEQSSMPPVSTQQPIAQA